MYGYFEGAEKSPPQAFFRLGNELAFRVPVRGTLSKF